MIYSNFYSKYKDSRDLSWRILIDQNICSLPISIQELCKNLSITLYNYQDDADIINMFDFQNNTKNNEGFTSIVNKHPVVFYDKTVKPHGRLRFTVAHELGHILLGHLETNNIACRAGVSLWNNGEVNINMPLESAANIFASRLLAPACVLKELNVTTAKQIMELTGLSYTASKIRLERLKELNARSKYYTNPLEIRVYNQFKDFINEYNNK